jgi:adenylyltransferase/sulfurtransferase
MSDPITISTAEASGEAQDRFHRFRLIGWWDQAKLSAARVLVIGAGALGNEIVKNLALLGVGQILVADMDKVENSNLSRSVLFREKDNGRYKSVVAAEAARGIYPEITSHAFVGNVVYDLGLGVFRWADVVIGGLDNREARLAINRACWRVGRPWIDGAIEQIQGVARVFVPGNSKLKSPISNSEDGPCYECTMSETDWKLLAMRRSCNLLTRIEMQAGKTPTTPTIGSIIAAVQCQEAVKLLHGMETLAGKGWVFAGLTADSYTIEYQRKADCLSHEPLEAIVSLHMGSADLTPRQLLAKARELLGATAVLDLGRDVLEKLVCPRCLSEEELFASLGRVSADKAWCPKCRDVRREVKTFHTIRGDEPFVDRTLSEIGVPAFDIVAARAGARSVGFELSADAAAVLGALADTFTPVSSESDVEGSEAQATTEGQATEDLEWA